MNLIIPLAFMALFAVACSAQAEEQTLRSYAPINNLKMYYEVRGNGPPLILVHGGIGASEAFGENVTLLARNRKVIVPHIPFSSQRATSD